MNALSDSKFADLIKTIEKENKISIRRGSDPELIVKKIPIGIPILDTLLGGGIPIGRFTLIAGNYSTCKTFLCQELIKVFQANDWEALYIDIEKTFDPVWFAKTGVDIDKLFVLQPDNGEQAFDVAVAAAEGGVQLIILDSLAAMVSVAEEDELMEKNTMGLQARLVSKGLKKLSAANKSNSTIILINQVRDAIGGYGNPEMLPSGRAQHFYSSVELRLRRGPKITDPEDKDKVIGCTIRCIQEKNKVGGLPLQSIELPFMYEGHIDSDAGLLEIAMDVGVVVQRGAMYTLFGERYRGKSNLLKILTENDDLMSRLRQAVEVGRESVSNQEPSEGF